MKKCVVGPDTYINIMSSDLSEDELYFEEEEVDSDQLDPIPDESLSYVRSLWVCNPIDFNLREVQEIRVPAEVDEEFPPEWKEMEEISGKKTGMKFHPGMKSKKKCV